MKLFIITNSGYLEPWVFSTEEKAMNFLLKWIKEDYELNDEEMFAIKKELNQTNRFDDWRFCEVKLDNENY